MTQGERMAKLEEKTGNIEKKVDKIIAKLDTLDEHLDVKYSAKWVERVVGGLIGMIVIAVFGALIALVIRG